MEIRILKEEGNEIEFELDNQTIAEIVRVYLQKDDKVKFAAWKKEHYSRPLKMKVRTDGKSPRKAIKEAVEAIEKELDRYEKEYNKAF